MKRITKWSFQNRSKNQKGQTTTYAVVLGFLIAVGLFVAIKYFYDRDNDINIHLPRVEVH